MHRTRPTPHVSQGWFSTDTSTQPSCLFYSPCEPTLFDSQSSAPEAFDMVTTVDVASRKNLAQISQVLTQIASGSEFSEDSPQFVPINEMVHKTITEMTVWMLQSDYSPLPRIVRRFLMFSFSRGRPRCRDSLPCPRILGRYRSAETHLYFTQ